MVVAAWCGSCTTREPTWVLILRPAEDYSALGIAVHDELGSRTMEQSYGKRDWDGVGWLWREKEEKVRPGTRSSFEMAGKVGLWLAEGLSPSACWKARSPKKPH